MVRNCYKEILKLKSMLENAKIPHEYKIGFCNGIAIQYPNDKGRVCSAIEHDYSYGHQCDNIEIMGLLTAKESEYDSVVGWLTAEDVFSRIKAHYESQKGKDSINE